MAVFSRIGRAVRRFVGSQSDWQLGSLAVVWSAAVAVAVISALVPSRRE